MSKEVEYVERYNPIDDIRSSDMEKMRSKEYGHETSEGYLYSDVAIISLHRYWTKELDNPLRSERSKGTVQYIVDALGIEASYRNTQLDSMEALYEQS